MPLIGGILNLTPDSFSDGGQWFLRENDHSSNGVKTAVEKILDRAQEMLGQGADFVDIGGESSRPGGDEIAVKEELRRVLPVLSKLLGT